MKKTITQIFIFLSISSSVSGQMLKNYNTIYSKAGNNLAINSIVPGDELWDTTITRPGFDYVYDIAFCNGILYAGINNSNDGVYVNSELHGICQWNGISWKEVGDGLDGTAYRFAVNGNKLYVAGVFNNAGGQSAKNIAMWDGASWQSLGGGIIGNINTIKILNDTLYAAGSFIASGSDSAKNIAKWDGNQWRSVGFNPTAYGGVNAIGYFNGFLYAGGIWSSSNLARWNGASWNNITTPLSNEVTDIEVCGGNLYFVCNENPFIGTTAQVFKSTDGLNFSSLGGTFNNQIGMLKVYNNELYISGYFTLCNSTSIKYFAKWNGSVWAQYGNGTNMQPGLCSRFDFNSNILYTFGPSDYNNIFYNNGVVYWNGTTWSKLDNNIHKGVQRIYNTNTNYSSYVNVIKKYGDTIIIGGKFRLVGDTVANNIALYNGNKWVPMGQGFNGPVLDIEKIGNDIYAGGAFDSSGFVKVNLVAKWNGSNWTSLDLGLTDSHILGIKKVSALSSMGNDLYAAGHFSSGSGNAVYCIAKWDGVSWGNIGNGLQNALGYEVVNDIEINDSIVYVGGLFEYFNGIPNPISKMAYWDGITWHEMSNLFSYSGEVYDIELDNGDLYICGSFTDYNTNATGVARWNGVNWEQIGNSHLASNVYSIEVKDGNLIATGSFTSLDGISLNRAAFWNGSEWQPLGSGMDNSTKCSFIDSTSVYIGGYMRRAGSTVSNNFACYHMIGSPVLTLPTNHISNISDTVYFNWGNVNNAINYRLQVSSQRNFSNCTLDTLISSNSLTKILNYEPVYYWRVQAITTNGHGFWSPAWDFGIIHINEVWPGDVNNDSLVSAMDLLSLGLAFGETGISRDSICNLWIGQRCPDWLSTQHDGNNMKYADCNGDGTVSFIDTVAINQNFSMSHMKLIGTHKTGADVYVVPSNNIVSPGQDIYFDINVGTTSAPVSDLYGLSFLLNTEPTTISTGTLNLSFSNSWLGAPGVNTIKLNKEDESSGDVVGAITGIDHIGRNGFGTVARLFYTINPAAASLDTITITLSNITANDPNGNEIVLNPISTSFVIDPFVGIENLENNHLLSIYPNPSSGSFTLELGESASVEIYNAVGSLIFSEAFEKGKHTISLDRAKGIYLMKARSGSTSRNVRMVIQ